MTRRSLVAPPASPSYDGSPMQSRVEPAPALTRNALIPASIASCFVLVYVVEANPAWVWPIGLSVMALYLLAPRIGQRSLARFDRDSVQLLAQGKKAELEARYRQAIGMRLFAAPAVVAERRGLVAAELGAPERAREAYLAALEGYPQGEAPLSVRLGLAHACYALGDDEEAIRHYRAVHASAGGLPRVKQSFAHALARRGESLDEAEKMAEELLASGEEPPRLLLRALVHAKRGQKRAAKDLLERTADASDPLSEQLRAEIDEALAG